MVELLPPAMVLLAVTLRPALAVRFPEPPMVKVIHPRQDRVTQWLAKHGSAVKPYLDAARAKADEWIDRDFDHWTAKLPEWKKEGSAAFERHLDDVKRQVTKAENDLKNSNHAGEAHKLKEKFDRWLDEAKK